MAKQPVNKISMVNVLQTSPETITSEDLDIIAATILSGDGEIIHVNPDLNEIGVDDVINIKDYVEGTYDTPIRGILDSPEVEVIGTINVTTGYNDVAMAIMSKHNYLNINVAEDCVRFRDWKLLKILSQNYPTLFIGGYIRKSTLANYTFPSPPDLMTPFNGVEYFNELYYFKNITSYLFRSCTSVKEISIPQDTTNISPRFAEGAINLEYVHNFENNPNIKTINSYVFYNCSKLKLTQLPPNIQAIEPYTFTNCANVEFSSFPESLAAIGDYAFQGCVKIKNIKIPPLVKRLGSHAFANCTSLIIADLNNVEDVITTAFYDCPSLTDLYMYNVKQLEIICNLAANTTINFHIRSINDFANIDKSGCPTQNGKYKLIDEDGNEITEYHNSEIEALPYRCLNGWSGKTVIAENATRLNDYCLAQTDVVNVILPSVKSIGQYAFYISSGIETFDFENVEVIEQYAFRNCTNFSANGFYKKIKSIGAYAFNGISGQKTTNIILNGGVSIAAGAFYGNGTRGVASYIVILDNSEKNTFIDTNNFINLSNSIRVVDLPQHLTNLPLSFLQSTTATNLVIRTDYVVSKPNQMATPSRYIFVPANLVEIYKLTTGWSSMDSKIKSIGGNEWYSTFLSYDEFADYPEEHRPLPLSSIDVEYDEDDNKLYVFYNDHKVIHTNERGYNLSVVSPASGVTIDSDHVVDYGSYSGDITVRVTSTYNPSISNSITFAV